MARFLALAVALAASSALAAACGGGEEPRRQPAATPAATAQDDVAEPRPHALDLEAARGRVTYCVDRVLREQAQPAVRAFNARHRDDGLAARLRVLPHAPRRNALLLGNGCDVGLANFTAVAQLAYAGLIEDVTDYVRGRSPEFMRAPLEAVRWEERYWGVPSSVAATLLYYNVGQGPPATWQELYEQAAGNDGLVYAGGDPDALVFHFLELAYSAGATVISRDGERSELDGAPALRALELMVTGFKDEAVLPEVLRYRERDATAAFGLGRSTYMLGWPWVYETLSKPHPVSGYELDDWDANEPPAFEGAEARSVLAGTAVVVARGARDLDAAVALADHLTSPEVLRRAARRYDLAPPLADLWLDLVVYEWSPAPAEHERAITQARPLPVTPASPAVLKAIERNVRAALAGRVTPAEALRAADREIDAALARFRELEGAPS